MVAAQPYAIAVVGFPDQFLYQDGVICYMVGSHVHLVGTRDWSNNEKVIDLESLVHQQDSDADEPAVRSSWKVLAYRDGLIACQEKTSGQSECRVLVVNAKCTTQLRSELLLKAFSFRPQRLSFIRLGDGILWYGQLQRLGTREKYYWDIGAVGLPRSNTSPQESIPKQRRHPLRIPLQGSEVGSTITFEVFGNELYGGSTEPWSDHEEKDWVSYYYCMRISPMDFPEGYVRLWKIPRRDHTNGVLNDMWSQLSIQKDDTDNQIYVTETRKEYPSDGSSFSTRTNYRHLLKYNGESTNDWTLEDFDAFQEPPRKRVRRDVHTEYRDSEVQEMAPVRDFIIQHNENRFYDSGNMSFVDLVRNKNEQQPKGRESHLAVRVASRKRKSPYESEDTGAMLRTPELDDDGLSIKGSEEDFDDTKLALWPPNDSPQGLLDLLDPKSQSEGCTKNSSADNFNILYMCHKPLPGQANPKLRPLVLLSFDPRCSIPGLRPLLPSTSSQARSEPQNSMELNVDRRTIARPPSPPSHWWMQPAAYTTIRHGFRLR